MGGGEWDGGRVLMNERDLYEEQKKKRQSIIDRRNRRGEG